MRVAERKLDTLQTIELAEGAEIRLRIAGPFLRVLAWVLDFFFLLLAIFVLKNDKILLKNATNEHACCVPLAPQSQRSMPKLSRT